MGILKTAATQQSSEVDYATPSGCYPGSWVSGVSAAASKTAAGGQQPQPIITVKFTINDPKAPTPLHNPDATLDFDMNDPKAAKSLYELFGLPMKGPRPDSPIVWDDSGLLKFNGVVGQGCSVQGTCEVKVSAGPRRARQGGGFWPPRYTIEDVSRDGEAAREAASLMAGIATFGATLAKVETDPPGDGAADDDDKDAASPDGASGSARRATRKSAK